MQAIHTKWLSPTNSRGARIKATCAAGSVTIGYPHELSGQAAYHAAAQALCDKLKWQRKLIGGSLLDGSFVFLIHPDAANAHWMA